MKKAVLLLAVLILSTAVFNIFAQETPESDEFIENVSFYDTGDTFISFSAGLNIPLFIHFPNNPDSTMIPDNGIVPGLGTDGAFSAPGPSGIFSWNIFILDQFITGFEVGGTFLFDHILENFSDVPSIVNIAGHFGYMLELQPFEIPISISSGISITKLRDETYIGGPFLKPSIGFYYNINPEWGIGGKLNYWWVPEIYFTDEQQSQTSFSNFLEVTFGATFHI